MDKIASVAELEDAILLLKVEQEVKEQLLREQFYLVYDSLKPLNLLKSTIKEVTSSPDVLHNLVGTAVGLATGYLSRKIVVRASGNILRKLLGSILQFGVTNIVARNPETIKTVSHFINQHIFQSNRSNSD